MTFGQDASAPLRQSRRSILAKTRFGQVRSTRDRENFRFLSYLSRAEFCAVPDALWVARPETIRTILRLAGGITEVERATISELARLASNLTLQFGATLQRASHRSKRAMRPRWVLAPYAPSRAAAFLKAAFLLERRPGQSNLYHHR
jgi:hypothetical protein